MSESAKILSLSFGLTFTDLYTNEGLRKLDDSFLIFLSTHAPSLASIYQSYRKVPVEDKTMSDFLITLAPEFEDFMGQLFQISPQVHTQQKDHQEVFLISRIKRQFVQRYAIHRYAKSVFDFSGKEIRPQLERLIDPFDEDTFAKTISIWLEDESTYANLIDLAARYAAWAALTKEGQHLHGKWILFKTPQKQDMDHLVPFDLQGKMKKGEAHSCHLRSGFSLTDKGLSRLEAVDQARYCIWCHHQGKDSCSKGQRPKGQSTFLKNALGASLTGCPLGQKISEMNEAKAQGFTIAALAIAMIDNPMIAATGHRICNECSRACIYQKQTPVDIPGTETQILRDVLELPWGVEIYSLLSRWNPFHFNRPFPLPDSGYKVLVVGSGPAGFTLAHHLLNEGHTVVLVEGLKIEPLPPSFTGVDIHQDRHPFTPIYSLGELKQDLSTRVIGGFGGVSEYGITVRWDKNFLTLIRLLLQRRDSFALFGGVRLGGTLTIDQAFNLHFDHIALCMGAGSPTLIPLKNSLAIGVRQASDFLMSLQLTGAFRQESLANLQIRLPAVVIGGGLTAFDTATELMAYYPVQVEKFYHQSQELTPFLQNNPIKWSESEKEIVAEYLAHGKEVINEREQAQKDNRPPDFQRLIQKWGGVTVVYRQEIRHSPAYRLNHEEMTLALKEGIYILDEATLKEIKVDQYDQALSLEIQHQGQNHSLPARTILIAAGTQPNMSLKEEEEKHFPPSPKGFQVLDEEGIPVSPDLSPKSETPHVLVSILDHKKAISFFGDMHPSFAGNVVKAMASAKQGYPIISRILRRSPSKQTISTASFMKMLQDLLQPQIHAVNRLTPTIVEVVVKAPLAARNFKPGQFYRLQNFETTAKISQGTRLAMEGIALTGASVDQEKGLLSTIVLEMGGSSLLCSLLQPGDPVVFMGPTGMPTEIPAQEVVLLAGGGLGNAVLFSIGQALKAKGCQVIYFAGYKKREDRYKVTEIEKAADQVVWVCDESPGFPPTRAQDLTFTGTIVEAMIAYATGQLKGGLIPLSHVQRLIVIGSDQMMAAVAKARKTHLSPYLNPDHIGIGSINSPMQCMMKGICAQCLQRQVDPSGNERIVFSCAMQDQNLDWVDFKSLNTRLRQNSVQEKLTHQWVRYCQSCT